MRKNRSSRSRADSQRKQIEDIVEPPPLLRMTPFAVSFQSSPASGATKKTAEMPPDLYATFKKQVTCICRSGRLILSIWQPANLVPSRTSLALSVCESGIRTSEERT